MTKYNFLKIAEKYSMIFQLLRNDHFSRWKWNLYFYLQLKSNVTERSLFEKESILLFLFKAFLARKDKSWLHTPE